MLNRLPARLLILVRLPYGLLIVPAWDALAEHWHDLRQPQRDRRAARKRRYVAFMERVDRTIAENVRRWGRPI